MPYAARFHSRKNLHHWKAVCQAEQTKRWYGLEFPGHIVLWRCPRCGAETWEPVETRPGDAALWGGCVALPPPATPPTRAASDLPVPSG